MKYKKVSGFFQPVPLSMPALSYLPTVYKVLIKYYLNQRIFRDEQVSAAMKISGDKVVWETIEGDRNMVIR